MKRKFLLLTLLVTPFFSVAQRISQVSSFEDGVALADQANKPLLVIVKIQATSNSQIPKSVIPFAGVVSKLKSNFVIFETEKTDKSITSLLSNYHIRRFPAYLFIHNGSDIFYSDFGYGTSEDKYLRMMTNAVVLSKNKTMAALEQEYLNDKTNNTKLKRLIENRAKKGITDNADLIEAFVENLKPNELNNYETLLFVLKAGPYADGKAYRSAAYTNRKIVDSIYRTEFLQVRTKMNTATIENTLNSAIKDKNLARAYAAANFSKSTRRSTPKRAQQSFNYNLLRYYKTINDTTNYFKIAINYYDDYYMTISADSIAKLDTKNRSKSLAEQRVFLQNSTNIVSKETMDSLLRANPSAIKTKKYITLSSSGGNSFANTLNNAAWEFYETGTKNISHLAKAMIWSRRSITLNPIPGYYDTLAHILYRMGYYEQAIITQEEAISIAKAQNTDFTKMREELKKMGERSL